MVYGDKNIVGRVIRHYHEMFGIRFCPLNHYTDWEITGIVADEESANRLYLYLELTKLKPAVLETNVIYIRIDHRAIPDNYKLLDSRASDALKQHYKQPGGVAQ